MALNFELVSVIIPAKNSAKYIGECLESVIHQSYTSLEIIAVVSPSTDRTLEIVKEYAAKDSRIVIIEKDCSIGVARQTAVDACRGAFVTFVDSDDTVHRDYIRVLKGAFHWSQLNPGIVQCGWSHDKNELAYSETGRSGYVYRHARDALIDSAKKDWFDYVVLWGKMFDTRLLKPLQFHDVNRSEEQNYTHFVFWEMMKTKQGHLKLGWKLYQWRDNPCSITHQKFSGEHLAHTYFGVMRLAFYDSHYECHIANVFAQRLCLDCMWTWDELKKADARPDYIDAVKRMRLKLLSRLIRDPCTPISRKIRLAAICANPIVGHILGMKIYDW